MNKKHPPPIFVLILWKQAEKIITKQNTNWFYSGIGMIFGESSWQRSWFLVDIFDSKRRINNAYCFKFFNRNFTLCYIIFIQFFFGFSHGFVLRFERKIFVKIWCKWYLLKRQRKRRSIQQGMCLNKNKIR